MYHGEKRGVLLVRLWKRYMLIDVKEQEVYDVDPTKVKAQGENIEWSPADLSDQLLVLEQQRVATVQLDDPRHRHFGCKAQSL